MVVAEVVEETELSILVEELIDAEQKAVDLAGSGAGLARINQQFTLVRSLHHRISELQLQLARQA